MIKKKDIGVYVPVVLGTLTAFGPFVTDFYLPVLPMLTRAFATSPAMVSLSLTAGMVGLAAGQLLIGPLTDKYGRKPTLVLSMALFALASVGCLAARDIHVFNAFRVLQGIGGAGGIVISKSMATDMYTGKELANFMALLGAINGIAPITAPVVGGAMAEFVSWQGIFCLLLVIGLLLMVGSMRLRETLPPARRSRRRLLDTYVNLFRVFRNPLFRSSTAAMFFAFFAFFAYIASSPFILQDVYGLSPLAYSLCFGLNALMIGVGALAGAAVRRMAVGLRLGAAMMVVGAVALAAALMAGGSVYAVVACFAVMMGGFGVLQPITTAIALDAERDNAGAASAVFGASNFVAGALSSPLVALGSILVSSSAVMVGGAAMCLACVLMLAAKLRKSAAR